MKNRVLGRTGLKVSELGFGCGSVGGLLVRGEYPEMRRAVARVEDGIGGSLVEAAIRFALSKPEISTALVGISSLEELEHAAACADRGPLPAEALGRLQGA